MLRKKDRNSGESEEQKARLGENNEIFDAEMWGISEAFN